MISQLSNVLKNVSDQNDPIHQITRDAMMNILVNLGGGGCKCRQQWVGYQLY